MTWWFVEILVFLRKVFFATGKKKNKYCLFLDFVYCLGIIYATDLLEEDGQDAFLEIRWMV